jgi:hypothetical protein
MDLNEFMDTKYPKHYAETLIQGDRIKATIRHRTDGNKNIIDADMIFIRCNNDKTITAYYEGDGNIIQKGEYMIEIPFNEIKQP